MSLLESRQDSGMLSNFTMTVLQRLLQPQRTKLTQKNFITRRSFVFRKGDDLQVINREIPVLRPEILADLQHATSHLSEENAVSHSNFGDDEARHEVSVEGETLKTPHSKEMRERTNSFNISDDKHMQREAQVRTDT